MRYSVRQVGLEGESFETARAAEPLGAGVGLYVCSQVGTVGECLTTQSAGEGFLSGMGSLMSAKKPRPRERLVARRAAILEVVGEEVHGQRRHRDIDLATVRTRPGVFPVDAAVGLFVTGQIRRRGVASVTFITRVLRLRRRSSCRGWRTG